MHFLPIFALALFAAGAPFAAQAADEETLPDASAPTEGLAQQCLTDLRTFENELAQAGFGVLPPGGYAPGYVDYGSAYGVAGTPREKMQALRDAAYVYAVDGDEQSCQDVLASMRTVYEEHQDPVGIESDDPDVRRAWRRAHLARTTPTAEMDRLMRADVVIGSEVRTPADEALGEIEDVVLDPARQTIAYVLVSRGGLFGIGGDLVPIPWSDLGATEDHEIYVLDVPPEAFEAAPTMERASFAETASEAWRGTLDQYWAGVSGN